MSLSVIIPTYNRVDILLLTLAAIENQTLPKNAFEVIVVDDGSNKRNRQRLKRYEPSYQYKLLEKEHGGLASSRNLGADHAKGDILYFLDDDVIPALDTLEQHLRSHERAPEPLAVVGSLPYPMDISRNCFLWYLEKRTHYDLYKNPKKYSGGEPPLPPLNGNSSIPRDLFFKIGKYDESFKHYGGEDLELGYRLAKAGVRFIYNPHAVGYHNHIKDFSQFCIDMERAGESLIGIYRKYPEIKAAKKIDILEDPIIRLPLRKKMIKLILLLTMGCPWVLMLPRLILRKGEPYYVLRCVLFPIYHWISSYHYALGMQKGLS